MNSSLFLLRLVSEMLDEKPTPDKLHCAKVIIDNLIEYYKKGSPEVDPPGFESSSLDDDAAEARRELTAE